VKRARYTLDCRDSFIILDCQALNPVGAHIWSGIYVPGGMTSLLRIRGHGSQT